MHIPPYHKKRSWQIFLLGIWIGAILAYIVLVFMYGRMYEDVLSEQIQLKTEINELKRQNETLLKDKENLEEKTSPSVLMISIEFTNEKELRLDRLITHQLEDLIKKELDSVIGKEVDSVSENDQLIVHIIENNSYTIDDLSYELTVEKVSISKILKLSIKVKKTD